MNTDENNEDMEGLGANAFERFIRDHRSGQIANIATEKMVEALEASKLTGATSELTIKIKFKPANGDQVQIDADVSNKLPKEKLPGGIMYLDEDNCLHMSDPSQRQLPLRTVVTKPKAIQEAPTKEIKQA